MKLATYAFEGDRHVGVVVADGLVSITRRFAHITDMKALVADWPQMRAAVEPLSGERPDHPLSQAALQAPIARPGKILAIGLNYADHIAESGMARPTTQLWFSKQQTSVAGPFDPIPLPRVSNKVDYEVELVAVIGKGGRYIPAERALEHVFGYCVGNDVSVRDWQLETPQWTLGKSFDGHAPYGPWITTSDSFDPRDAAIRCEVNGQTRQSSNVKHLVFDVAAQVEHLSKAMTLEPGDLIFTGTPGGVGAAMNPQQFLQQGDVVRCEIEGLGAIVNRCEAE